MSSIDVVYAVNMKPGDLFAGKIAPDAPTRPVQTWANALELASITPYTDEAGVRMLHLKSASFDLTPIPAAARVLVIRL